MYLLKAYQDCKLDSNVLFHLVARDILSWPPISIVAACVDFTAQKYESLVNQCGPFLFAYFPQILHLFRPAADLGCCVSTIKCMVSDSLICKNSLLESRCSISNLWNGYNSTYMPSFFDMKWS